MLGDAPGNTQLRGRNTDTESDDKADGCEGHRDHGCILPAERFIDGTEGGSLSRPLSKGKRDQRTVNGIHIEASAADFDDAVTQKRRKCIEQTPYNTHTDDTLHHFFLCVVPVLL